MSSCWLPTTCPCLAAEDSLSAPEIPRRIAPPLALLVVVLVAAAWLVTWSTSQLTMSLLAMVAPGETFKYEFPHKDAMRRTRSHLGLAS